MVTLPDVSLSISLSFSPSSVQVLKVQYGIEMRITNISIFRLAKPLYGSLPTYTRQLLHCYDSGSAVCKEARQAEQGAGSCQRPHHAEAPVLAHHSHPDGAEEIARIVSREVGARGEAPSLRPNPVDEQCHGRGLGRAKPEAAKGGRNHEIGNAVGQRQQRQTDGHEDDARDDDGGAAVPIGQTAGVDSGNEQGNGLDHEIDAGFWRPRGEAKIGMNA